MLMRERGKLRERQFNASNLVFFHLVIIWFLLSWRTSFQRNVKFPCNINEQALKRDKSQLWNVDLYTAREEGMDLQGRKSWKTLSDVGDQVSVDIYLNSVVPSSSVRIVLNRIAVHTTCTVHCDYSCRGLAQSRYSINIWWIPHVWSNGTLVLCFETVQY